MRRRILAATLLAVAVTAVVLGLPLGGTWCWPTTDFTRADLSTRSQQIATSLDDQVAAHREIDVESVLLAVPRGAQLEVRTRDHRYTYGADPGPDPLTESVPMVQSGTVTIAAPSDPVRAQQFQVAGLVLMLVVLSAGTGTI